MSPLGYGACLPPDNFSTLMNWHTKHWLINWLIDCCCCSVTQSWLTLWPPWIAACQVSLSFTISQSLLKLMSIESVMPSSHLIFCHPLVLLPSIFPSIRAFFQWVISLHQVTKVRSVSFSISPSNEWLGLISFRIHWLDLLAVQGTLKGLLQPHISEASILWCSAFFIVPTLTSI